MALPTLTSNSPSAGSIAWTAFGIQFDGVSYPISAGSTASKFVWWEYATKTIKASNTLPTNLQEEDYLLFLNKGGVGAVVPMTDVLDGSLVVPQSIFANAIAADQIDATHIKAGAVDADAIAAGAITTEKLTVGSVGDNLVTNGSFEEFANGVPLGWTGSVETGTGTYDVVSGQSSSGAYAARLILPNATSGSRLSQSDDKVIPVSSASGRSWYLSARIGASVAITKGFYLQVRWLNASKGLISTSSAVTNVGVTTSWAVVEGRVTPPSTARYMRVTVVCTLPNVATNVYIDEVTAREVVVGAVIADDAITAAHIKADAIDGKKITGVTIVGGEIKTSETTNAIAARMGPVSVYDPFGGGQKPGIGFQKVGAAGSMPGMYSTDGADLNLVQGHATDAQRGLNAYLTLGMDNVDIRAQNRFDLTSGNGGQVGTGSGRLDLYGTPIMVNGDMAAHQRAEFTTTGFFVQGGQSWDSGPVALDTGATRTVNNDFCAVGPYSGSIKFLKPGYYSVSLLIVPRGDPGTGWTRLNHGTTGERLAQTGNNSGMWETYAITLPVYFAANDYVRSQMSYPIAHNVDCRWKIVKYPYSQ